MDKKGVKVKRLPSGMCDFKEIIENDCEYVDKTSFIIELLNKKEKVTNILRPRRFGKTLMQSTLKYFFDIREGKENRDLFKGLDIERSPFFKEQGQYPVINLTFKNIRESNWNKCFEKIKDIIGEEYKNHSYLIENSKTMYVSDVEYFTRILNKQGSEVDLSNSLIYLSQFLFKYYNKRAIVLIDEYDTPIIEGSLEGYYKEVTNFISGFLSGGLKGNNNLYFGLMTGITKLSNTGIFSELNNVSFYPITNKNYSDKFGFTEAEVQNLLNNYGMEERYEEVRDWYNGYTIGNDRIYNPYSLLKYIAEEELISGWLSTSSNELVKKKLKILLEDAEKKEMIRAMEDLYNGKDVKIEPREDININEVKDKEGILSLLLNSGYLTFEYAGKEGERKDSVLNVRIPNKEVREVYKTIQKESLSEEYKGDGFSKLLKSIELGSEKEIEESIKFQLMDASFHDFGSKNLERDYHNFVHGMIRALGEKYEITSNREVGMGRCDIILIPKSSGVNRGIVLEFKANSSKESAEEEKTEKLAKEAIEQIKSKGYADELRKRGISKTRIIGMGFINKGVSVKIENI